MKICGFVLLILIFGACSTPTVRSTVDSYGEEKASRADPLYFNLQAASLLEKQSVIDCKEAARDSDLHIVDAPCKDCRLIEVHARLAGTDEALRSTPGFANSWAGFGRRSRFGTGLYSTTDVQSFPVTGREIDIDVYLNSLAPAKNPAREIAVRSLGSENSVSAVAYEMCKAAFRDYPENLKGRYYELKRPKTASTAASTPEAQLNDESAQ
jgi:hypothetical protein